MVSWFNIELPLKLLSAHGAYFFSFCGVNETWATKRMSTLSCDGYFKERHADGAIEFLWDLKGHERIFY